MKSSYTFSATDLDTDYPRIVRENPGSTVIVLSTKGKGQVTFVKEGTPAGARAYACGKYLGYFRATSNTWSIYEGDIHQKALGRESRKVEAY